MNSFTDVISRSPWHDGERALQRTVGVADQMEYIGSRVILDHLIEQHRRFYPLLPYVVVGAVDSAGNVWASMLTGAPGFLQAPNESTLRVAASAGVEDPVSGGLGDGQAIGLLGIDLQTRRRNRLNGKISRVDDHAFEIEVEQSYGNCHQYIHIRNFSFARDPRVVDTSAAETSTQIDARAAKMIREASTFFVASYVDLEGGTRHVDVSHKGGNRGFVRVDEDGLVTIPDFSGNLYFNTLGNILVNPKCGLVFVDFASGDILQLTGTGEVILDSPEILAFQGAERLLKFTPEKVVFRNGALAIRWGTDEKGTSPTVTMTGNWEEAAGRLRAARLTSTWRPLQIRGVVDESETIRSLYLAPTDGIGLIAHKAGQYLPIRVKLPGHTEETQRDYTISCSPSDKVCRISVKRDGSVSQYLHSLKVGDIVEAREPNGEFTVDTQSTRMAVFLCAGVGITPMLAMLRHSVHEGLRKGRMRPSWLVYSFRRREERAFDREINGLIDASKDYLRVTRVLGDISSAEEGDYEIAGRIDIEWLAQVLPFDGYPLEDGCDFYLCGPGSFMQDLYSGLRALGVPDKYIHAEAFGPASFKRDGVPQSPLLEPATEPVTVVFSKTGKAARWTPEDGTLLQFARSWGIHARSSCESGVCGTCRTKISRGEVAYLSVPVAKVDDDEVLICCSAPAVSEVGEIILDI